MDRFVGFIVPVIRLLSGGVIAKEFVKILFFKYIFVGK